MSTETTTPLPAYVPDSTAVAMRDSFNDGLRLGRSVGEHAFRTLLRRSLVGRILDAQITSAEIERVIVAQRNGVDPFPDVTSESKRRSTPRKTW